MKNFKNMKDRMRDNKGMTLVEVLVVIALIAIMMVIAIPNIMGSTGHTRLKRAARDVLTDLQVARSYALSKNMQYRLVFTLGVEDGYTRENRANTTDPWVNDDLLAPQTLASSVNITLPAASFDVIFNPNGTAENVSICLENIKGTNDDMKVEVTATTGRVEIITGC